MTLAAQVYCIFATTLQEYFRSVATRIGWCPDFAKIRTPPKACHPEERPVPRSARIRASADIPSLFAICAIRRLPSAPRDPVGELGYPLMAPSASSHAHRVSSRGWRPGMPGRPPRDLLFSFEIRTLPRIAPACCRGGNLVHCPRLRRVAGKVPAWPVSGVALEIILLSNQGGSHAQHGTTWRE